MAETFLGEADHFLQTSGVILPLMEIFLHPWTRLCFKSSRMYCTDRDIALENNENRYLLRLELSLKCEANKNNSF